METIKQKRLVETEVTVYKFEASEGDYHQDLEVKNGEITCTGCWDSRNGGGSAKGEPDFANSCRSAIRFIAKRKPAELKNIYNALSDDNPMKDFCRQLQKEMMAELDF